MTARKPPRFLTENAARIGWTNGDKAIVVGALITAVGVVIAAIIPFSQPAPVPTPCGIERFVDLGNDLLKDTQTKFVWTRKDTGKDISWSDAVQYCARRGNGWRLPSLKEMQQIVDRDMPPLNNCVERASQPVWCHISPLFKLTRAGLWTADSGSEPGSEIFIGLPYGTVVHQQGDESSDMRAICVSAATDSKKD